MIIEKLQRKLQRTATVYGALAAFAFAGMGHVATAQTAKSAEGAVAAPATIDATLAAYQQVPLSQISAESMGAKARPAKAKPVAAEEEESAAPSKPGSEGIKVHGHWVLQVKNADGTLGERREFENSLITTYSPALGAQSTSGAAALVAALTGNLTVSGMAIAFVQGPLTGDPSRFCGPLANFSEQCFPFIDAKTPFASYAFLFQNISNYGTLVYGLNETANFFPTASIVLSGNYTVQPASDIGTGFGALTSIAGVQSIISGCESSGFELNNDQADVPTLLVSSSGFRTADASPSQCIYSNKLPNSDVNAAYALTSTSIPGGPLAVTQGQIIQVTFTLSFS